MWTHEIAPVLQRTLDVGALGARKSHFLFGPRQTGKTFLVRQALPDAVLYDLLDAPVYAALARNPRLIDEQVTPGRSLVIIDEIQRLPELLNEVHRLIETRGLRFVMTGSSPRKLRRAGVNLLGGRARVAHLHPFSAHELGDAFDLTTVLSRGTLPSIYFSEDPVADLEAYTGLYLQQEVAAEALTRNVPAFGRFLKVAALCNATMVNFTNVANDAQVARTTVREYFQILLDTLVLHELPAWKQSRKRRPITASKYYFFDIGVAGSLQGRLGVAPATREYGEALETWTMHELMCWRDYVSGEPLSYWRSASGYEVDFLLGDHTAIEVKAAGSVSKHDLRSLHALADEQTFKRLVCVCQEPRTRRIGDVTILPVKRFVEQLWGGEFA
jgi:uncharacterized protein